MGAFKVRYPLPTKTITAGGNAQIELLGLPLDARVAGFLFEIAGTGTAASSTCAVTPVTLSQLLANIDFDSDFAYCRATGRMLHALQRLMAGYSVASSAMSVTCDTNGVAVRGMLYLPLADERSRNPYDTAVPVRLLREKTINMQFKAALTLGTSPEVTVSAASLKTTAILVPQSDDTIPAKTKIYFEDWASAQANLAAGHYTHLGVYDETDLAVTIAQYSQFSASFDGQQLLDRVPTQHLIADWNEKVCKAQDQELSYQASQNLELLPLIFQGDKYKLTQAPFAQGTVRVDIDSGSNSSARYFYRQVVPIDEAQARSAAVRLGHDPDNAKMSVKTDSKEPLKGSANRVSRHMRILPKRLER